jgi:predicted nuclease with TOPRIM domain
MSDSPYILDLCNCERCKPHNDLRRANEDRARLTADLEWAKAENDSLTAELKRAEARRVEEQEGYARFKREFERDNEAARKLRAALERLKRLYEGDFDSEALEFVPTPQWLTDVLESTAWLAPSTGDSDGEVK